jgi:hypothetical protein
MEMFDLNGVLVSGKHGVYYKKQWIPVKSHPKSKLITDYNEPFIYCINTTTKVICINKDTYIDWDEIYDCKKNSSNFDYLDSLAKYHTYLDGGFSKNTEIILTGDKCVNICNVKVNDILTNGEKVYGIVEIDGSTVFNQYWYNKAGFMGGPNIQFFEQNKDLAESKHTIDKSEKLYHLLTDKKSFFVGRNKIKVHDYNYCVDNILNKKI